MMTLFGPEISGMKFTCQACHLPHKSKAKLDAHKSKIGDICHTYIQA